MNHLAAIDARVRVILVSLAKSPARLHLLALSAASSGSYHLSHQLARLAQNLRSQVAQFRV